MSAVSRMKIRNRLLLNITLALAVSVSGCVKAPPKQYVQPQNEQVGGVAAVERQEIVDEMKERDKAQLVQFQRDIKKLKGRHPFSPYAPETEVEAPGLAPVSTATKSEKMLHVGYWYAPTSDYCY